ncbi:hypothetical protein [Microbulbifer litoralis]|uniref:hypothetical protein n=1 Tax=Microbulbifer litoralis TaxID=2933965 RepID=UPI0020284F89|nr:hypothetical protein [Microbulbifer sp. GX H0434]
MDPIDADRPALEEKTRFLLSVDSYPEGTGSVRLVETHMARVFLTDRHAYKMKKPVRTRYLDFSSLDKRYGVCRQELRLNRRLTDNVYLDVVPLRLVGGDRLSLGGAGTPVEWLVKMRRLAREDCMVARIDALATADLVPLLERLCAFYRRAPVIPLTAEQYLLRLRRHSGQFRDDLLLPQLAQDRGEIRELAASLLDYTHRSGTLLGERAESGLIVEGHGDLRPEHCFLCAPPQVIDCLEFSRDLRCLDPLDELSYLALECELLGRGDLAAAVVSSYCGAESPADSLSPFYKAYRAFLRARLAAAHLLDEDVDEPDKWLRKTRAYLDAAQRHCP